MLIAATLLAFGCAKKQDAGHYNVLIIGDSISEGYTTALQSLKLSNIEIVHSQNPGADGTNSRDTQHGVEQIDYWLDHAGDIDLVSYNQGMWDMCPDLPDTYHDIDQYKENLRIIMDHIQARRINVMFMKSTFAPKNSCRAPYVLDYNAAAIEVMNEKHIPVYDLYSVAYDNRQYFQHLEGQGDVHFTDTGYMNLAKFVLQSMYQQLGSR